MEFGATPRQVFVSTSDRLQVIDLRGKSNKSRFVKAYTRAFCDWFYWLWVFHRDHFTHVSKTVQSEPPFLRVVTADKLENLQFEIDIALYSE